MGNWLLWTRRQLNCCFLFCCAHVQYCLEASLCLLFMGALTAQSYAFVSRPWELKSIESVDVFDSLGSNVRIDVFNDRVVRVLPSIDEDKNEEWISNRTRLSFEGLAIQRIGFPLLRVRLEVCLW